MGCLLCRYRREKEDLFLYQTDSKGRNPVRVSTRSISTSGFSYTAASMLTVPDGGSREEENKQPTSVIRTPSRFSRSVTLAAVPFSESARAAAAAVAAAAAEAGDQPEVVKTMKKTKSEKEYNPGLRSMLYGLNFRKEREAANLKKLQKKILGTLFFIIFEPLKTLLFLRKNA